MRRFTRPLAFAAGAALAVGALLVPSLPGPADAQTSTTIVKQQGFETTDLLILTARPTGQVVRQSGGEPQTFSSGCPIPAPGIAGPLLTATGLPTTAQLLRVGFDGERIGVGQKSDGGSGCYEVNSSVPGQALNLSFGTAAVKDMSLDIQFKGEVGLEAVGYFGSTPVSVRVDDDKGDASDDGPDCSGCDHYRVLLTPESPINSLVLKPKVLGGSNTSSGSIALSGGFTEQTEFSRGGRTYTGTGSVFELVTAPEGVIGCDGAPVTDADTGVQLTHLAAGTVPTLVTDTSTNTCTPAPYLITRDLNDDSLDTVLIALPNVPTDAFVVKVPFTDPQNVSRASNGDYVLTEPTKVDYLTTRDGVLLPEEDRVKPLTLCDGTYPATSTSSNSSPYRDLIMSVDELPDGGNQGVCGIERTITLSSGSTTTAADSVTVTETVLIVGDPRLLGN
jgi:hypothetical protein